MTTKESKSPALALVEHLGDDLADSKASPYEATLTQLRAWLIRSELPPDTRLPTERELASRLGVSRGSLRKALAKLEDEGQLWRHVGKGTFVGRRRMDVMSLDEIDRNTNPAEVMRTRQLIEPVIAREAALNATRRHMEDLQACAERTRAATSWREYETADNQMHRTIAEATGNTLLLALFDAMNAVRRTVVWGVRRSNGERPPTTHHSFAEHDRILEAIAARDMDGAEAAMAAHLRAVESHLLRR